MPNETKARWIRVAVARDGGRGLTKQGNYASGVLTVELFIVNGKDLNAGLFVGESLPSLRKQEEKDPLKARKIKGL